MSIGGYLRLAAILLCVVLSCGISSVRAQSINEKNVKRYIDSLTLSIQDSTKVKFAMAISNYYQDLPGDIKKDKDSAAAYTAKASFFALRSGSKRFQVLADMHKADLLLQDREFEKGMPLFEQSAAYLVKNNLLSETVIAWEKASRFVIRKDETFSFLVDINEQLRKYYASVKDTVRENMSFAEVADVHFRMGLLDKAEAELETAIQGLEATNYPYIHFYYNRLSYIARYKGNYAKALHFDLEAVQKLSLPRDSFYANNYYRDLADLYFNIGPKEKFNEYQIKSISYSQNSSPLWRAIIESQLFDTRDGNPRKALESLLAVAKKYTPNGSSERYDLNISLGTAYANVKEYASGEKYYLEMLRIEEGWNRGYDANAQLTYFFAAKFYDEWGKFDKAEPLLQKLLAVPAGRSTLGTQREAHYMQYRADSAKGNYQQALYHLRRFKEYYDIIYSTTKSWQLQEITVKYETEKKEHQLKALTDSNLYQQARLRILNDSILAYTRQRQIDDLKRNLDLVRTTKDLRLLRAENLLNQAQVASLSDSITNTKRLQLLADKHAKLASHQKEQSIKLLTGEAELNKRKLADAVLRQNLVIAGIALLLLTCGVLGYFFMLKQKHTKRIQATNKTLKRVVEEKEWLLKEVHHRVKNNLHTIVSLLESQSAFLSDAALAAVLNSQNRVYTMSLIHQKLYVGENTTAIDMSIYLPELIQYLEQSYDVRNKVRFHREISSILLPGSLAVPVGLIVNEAVTNSIKYAFKGVKNPVVDISFHKTEEHKFLLRIADNGTGISPEAVQHRKNSLGLTLIYGLAQDISGTVSISNNEGTCLCVTFVVDNASSTEWFQTEHRPIRSI